MLKIVDDVVDIEVVSVVLVAWVVTVDAIVEGLVVLVLAVEVISKAVDRVMWLCLCLWERLSLRLSE